MIEKLKFCKGLFYLHPTIIYLAPEICQVPCLESEKRERKENNKGKKITVSLKCGVGVFVFKLKNTNESLGICISSRYLFQRNENLCSCENPNINVLERHY